MPDTDEGVHCTDPGVAISTAQFPQEPTFDVLKHDGQPDARRDGKSIPCKELHPNSCSVGGFRYGSSNAAHSDWQALEEQQLEKLAEKHPRLLKDPTVAGHVGAHKLLAAGKALSHETDHDPAHECAPFAVKAQKGLGLAKEAAPFHAVAAHWEATHSRELAREPEPEPTAQHQRDAGHLTRRSRSSSGLTPLATERSTGGAKASSRGSYASSALEGRITRRRGSEVVIKM